MAVVGKIPNETSLSTDINVITAEINAYQRVAGEAIFEIGKRLKHVKENDLTHGEFGDWLEEIGMTPRNAQQFMQITTELDSKAKSVSHLGFAKLLQIAQITSETDRQEFVEQPHTIPSTGETKKVDEMTVRELREVKAELKKEQERRQRAEQDYESIRQALVNKEETVQDDVQRVDNSTEINGTALEFSTTVRSLIQRYAYLQNYKSNFASMNEISRDEYEKSFDALISFATQVRKELQFTRQGDVIIEMEGF
jgi:hypothetical protein